MKSISAITLLIVFVAFDTVPPPRTPACLSAEERTLYDLIMAYRKENKLGPIPLSESLTYVAQTHARDLTSHYTFDVRNKCNPHSWSPKGR